jgi:hypothetical protein
MMIYKKVYGVKDKGPNPKAKLLDQVREVMRLKHYSLRTEHTYCDWIKRYIWMIMTWSIE